MILVYKSTEAEHFPPSHLLPVPEWLVPLFSSSPTFDTPPDAVSGRLLHPTALPPSGAGPAACGCPWVRFPPLIHWESEPRKRKSTCSPRYLCGMKDKTQWEEEPDSKKRTQERWEDAKLKGKCCRGWKHTAVGISSTAVWVEASDRPSSACTQSLHIPGCCPLSLHFPSCHPMSLTGYNGLCPLCPLPLQLPGAQRRTERHQSQTCSDCHIITYDATMDTMLSLSFKRHSFFTGSTTAVWRLLVICYQSEVSIIWPQFCESGIWDLISSTCSVVTLEGRIIITRVFHPPRVI